MSVYAGVLPPPTPRTRSPITLARLLGSAALLLLAGPALSAQELTLTGENWTLAVQPQTLAVTATLIGGQRLSLSSPGPAPLLVDALRVEGRQLRWLLPEANVAVEMELDGDELVARFTASAPGSFCWPLLAPMAERQAWILPLFERPLRARPRCPVGAVPQRTLFGDELELIANFRAEPFAYDGAVVPGHSIAARSPGSSAVTVYPSP